MLADYSSQPGSTLAKFEKGLRENDENIAPSAIYAYACLRSGVPYANGAPNLSVDFPAMQELAREKRLPICGKVGLDARSAVASAMSCRRAPRPVPPRAAVSGKAKQSEPRPVTE